MHFTKQSIVEGWCLLSCTYRQVKFAQIFTLTIMTTFLMLSFFHSLWLFEISQGGNELLNLSLRWNSKSGTRKHLMQLHKALQSCVEDHGDGLLVSQVDLCKVSIRYPEDTPNFWVYVKSSTGVEVQESKNLTWTYDICQVLRYWREAPTRGAFMTQDMLDCYLKEDNLDQVVYHIVSGGDCESEEACISLVRSSLPHHQLFSPGQAQRCALIGNSANLISNISFAKEIDGHDTVIRMNDARTDKAFVKWSGKKTTIRFVNERVTKALDHIIKKNRIKNEIIVLRRALGGRYITQQNATMDNNIQISTIVQEQGGGLQADKVLGYSSGYLALNLAAFFCKTLDLYGFSVEPGPQSSWSRYFSNPRFGHSPLRHKAYYHLLECLRVVNLKSASRITRNKTILLPGDKVIQSGYEAILSLRKANLTPTSIFKGQCHKTSLA